MTVQGAVLDLGAEIRNELTQLADLLEAQAPAAWDTLSLCQGWRVRDLVAHLTLPAHHSAPAVLGSLVRSRFRWHVTSERFARRDAKLQLPELLAALRSERLQGWRPPGGGAAGALVHAVVHGLDATIPLGLQRELPAGRARAVLDGLVAPSSLKHFGVDVAGLALSAPDVGWSHGSGRPVPADAADLILMLSARRPLPVPS